ncbi:FAD/NAD(P)-binding oxidoreductase [Amycolatopsis sp. NPDC021455]|uniref:NAD(P)/FAD-dependent oxidoreductase n=1 Tax=Amycolatopsis sp. NPDC021455 TaxID=3154901 RepID=UPI0033BFD800
MKRIVILGGGTGGTLAANRLCRDFGEGAQITVVDRDDDHVYQPGLLFVPFGTADADELVRSRPRQLADGTGYHGSEVDRVDVDADRVHLADGTVLRYDALVIATGATLLPEKTDGLTGPGWRSHVDTFYDLDGAVGLASALRAFDGGRLVVDVLGLPVKCPVAPLAFCLLADWFFTRRGIRDRVELTYVTPLDAAFDEPVAARTLAGLLAAKNIELVTGFATGEVDGTGERLVSADGREVAFDQAVVVPRHGGASYVDRSPGLGDELGFVRADEHTLRAEVKDNIFVIGDAAALPAAKTASVAYFEGEVLARNVGQFLDGRPLDASFDGHTTCFVESGFGKALLMDFNYDTEPLPGHFPAETGLPLLKESRLNHLGSLLSPWFYWHNLLPGRDLPGVSSEMPRAGKQFPEPAGR